MSSLSIDLATNSLNEFAESFDHSLISVLPKPVGMESHVVEAMRYALLAGGKRLRPFLVMKSSSLYSIDPDHAMRVAVAVECVHTYSLIHDDLPAMDDDDMRRGQPSVHKKFDEATAILAGDALLTIAFEILADSKTHPDAAVRCELIGLLSRAIGAIGMVGGQIIDLKAEKQPLSEEEIIRMQQMKTGALIVFSCEAGAILAKVKNEDEGRQILADYGRTIGLAFQIVDDLLDIEGSSEDIGKTAGKDIEAGKATLVSLMGAKRAREKADELIDRAIKSLDLFDERADILRSLARFVRHRAH
ncbi:MAG: polyprenyl synthetase family protein [Alphaproteobacteria bacterium]|nr:polyprenyl synthetase family protein [Alphaproteobacteria bacterium]HPF48057.1 polyprenyl synthetase family protein [Emcibacteraceae bacterium]HRW28683.1 polyprenyl synthetase family protein [Emcibacteraceae bacterium]